MRRVWIAVVLLAGCGDGLHAPEIDAAPPDTRGVVTLRMKGERGAFGGLQVFFQNADSQLVLATHTDDNGVARAFMNPGGFVTVLAPRGIDAPFYALYTYAGVKPEDELVLDLAQSALGSLELSVRVPLTFESSVYKLYISCASGGPFTMSPGILQGVTAIGCPTTVNLLASATNVLGRPHFLYSANATVPQFGSVTLVGDYEEARPTAVSVVNVPPAVTEIFGTQQLAGLPFPNDVIDLIPGNGQASTMIDLPPADAMLASRLDLSGTGVIGFQHVLQWGPNGPVTIDVGGGVRSYTSFPRFEVTSQSLQWTEAEEGLVANAVIAGLSFSTPIGNIQWTVFGPRTDEPILRLPVFPRRDFNPAANGVVQVTAVTSMAVDGGYDRIRHAMFGAWSRNEQWPIDADRGRIVYQTLGFMQVPD